LKLCILLFSLLPLINRPQQGASSHVKIWFGYCDGVLFLPQVHFHKQIDILSYPFNDQFSHNLVLQITFHSHPVVHFFLKKKNLTLCGYNYTQVKEKM